MEKIVYRTSSTLLLIEIIFQPSSVLLYIFLIPLPI